MPLTGVDSVKRRYKYLVRNISADKTEAALYAVLTGISSLAATMTPVLTSNLINSRYIRIINIGEKTSEGWIGYTAEYAGAVHSAPGTLKGQPRPASVGGGLYWEPTGEPGFLVKGAEQFQPYLQSTIEGAYRV